MGQAHGAANRVRRTQGNVRRTNFIIDKKLKERLKEEAKIYTLLLLGTGESGKTTLLKLMSMLYGTTKPQLEEDVSVAAVRAFILLNLQELVKMAPRYCPIKNANLSEETLEEFVALTLNDRDHPEGMLPDNMVKLLDEIWKDKSIQETWERHRESLQVHDNLPHFMDKLSEVFDRSYSLCVEDWLRVRVRSTGVQEREFHIESLTYRIVDIGGQRSERKKWMHYFSNVQAIIYVVAVNEYDQVLFEDKTKNRMEESMDVFDRTIHNKDLENVGWILFLNKTDLYMEKLRKSPIKLIDDADPSRSRFTDFKGPSCPTDANPASTEFQDAYAAGIEYFTSKFMERLTDTTKKVYVHETCAMDKRNIDSVFARVQRDLRQIVLDQGTSFVS